MVLRSDLAAILVLAFALDATALRAGPRESAAPSVGELVKARCIFCHSPALMLGFGHRVVERDGRDALDRFLAGHHAPDEAARKAIVTLLAGPPDREEQPDR